LQHGLVLRAASRPGGLIAIQLAGVVDAHTLDRFESALDKALEHGARSLLLDCSELRYMSSSGFGELIRYHDRLRERGGTMVLARVAPKVAVILEMLGLKSLIPIVDSLEEGIRVAQAGAPAPAPQPAETPAPSRAPSREGDTAGPGDEAPAGGVEPAGPEVVCPFCDAVLRAPGAGTHLCAGCGAPFALADEGDVRWEWAPEDPARVETMHLTLDARPRSIAALTIAIEALLGDRGVAHVRLRRFAREAGQACRLLAEHAYGAWSREDASRRAGPLHVLLLAGDDRLVVRAVERGRALDREAASVFATQADHLAQFAYRVLGDGVHSIEFVLLYHDAEVGAR